MKYMQVFALSVFLRALACADTTSAKSLGHVQTDAPPACGTPTGIHRQQIVFLDRFGKTDSFPPEYETFDGPGAAEIVRRDRAGEAVLRYYSTPRGDEFAHDQSTIGIDVLGRPWVPSLRIARPFRGDVWTLTTKVTYGFDRPTNGRGVFISVGVGENPQQPDRAVRISRTNDNADAPESRGDLGVDMVSADGESQASERFPLNRLDTYSFCIQRTQGNLSVSVSNDGIAYRRAATYSVPPGAGQDRQWFIIDGMAFAPGASADIHYVLLRAPAIPTARKATAPRRTFRRRGTPDKTISLSAKAISDAIRAGQDVDIRFAAITGPVTIAPRLKNRITFESTVFTGAVSGANATFDDNLACVNCRFAGPVNFSNALFRRKADFSGAAFDDDTRFIYTRFNDGADFTGAHFKTRAWFRVARFGQPTSFYYSDFDEGADFSSGTTFEKDVTFADFGFGSSAQSAPVKPDMAFFGSTFKDRLMFVSTLQRPASPLGEEISLQQADIKHLVLTSGDSRLTKSEPEQTGKALWIIRTNLSLLNAKVDTLVMKNLSMTGVTDFRGVAFDGPRDSIRLFNVDFANLKLDAWPVGKVLATPESRERLMSTFSANNNTVAARVVSGI